MTTRAGKLASFGHSQRTEVFMDVMGEVFRLRPKIVFYDNKEKTEGHLQDGRPVVKKEGRWIYASARATTGVIP